MRVFPALHPCAAGGGGERRGVCVKDLLVNCAVGS